VNGVRSTAASISGPYRGDRITVSTGGVSRQTGSFTVVGPLAKIAVKVATPATDGTPFQAKAIALDALGSPVV